MAVGAAHAGRGRYIRSVCLVLQYIHELITFFFVAFRRMIGKYQWRFRTPLKHFEIINTPFPVAADDLGLGKTVMIVSFLASLYYGFAQMIQMKRSDKII